MPKTSLTEKRTAEQNELAKWIPKGPASQAKGREDVKCICKGHRLTLPNKASVLWQKQSGERQATGETRLSVTGAFNQPSGVLPIYLVKNDTFVSFSFSLLFLIVIRASFFFLFT